METVSYKESDGRHGQHHQDDHGEIDVLSPRALLALIGLGYIFPGFVDVAICAEQFFADDVDLFALFVSEDCGLLQDVVHVHDALGHYVDLLVFFVHQPPLHLKIDLLLSLALASLLALFVRKSVPRRSAVVPRRSVVARWLLLRGHQGRRVIFGLGKRSIIVVCGLEQLISSVSLDAELLFGGADLARGVWVEVGLL